MSYNFTSGTIGKTKIYDFILDSLISAGWQNISSDKIIDGDVMFSTGINGDKKIYIQFRPYSGQIATSQASYNNYHIQLTKYPYMSYRLQPSYVPGASGTTGVFGYPSRYHDDFVIFNTSYYTTNPNTSTIEIDEGIQYYLHVDKEKLILFTKARTELTKYWQMNYLGLPAEQYSRNNEGRGTTAFTTFNPYGSSFYYQGIHINLSDYPDAGDSLNATLPHNWPARFLFTEQPAITPNMRGKHFFSELYYGDNTYGVMGKFDDIYAANSKDLNSGDKVLINNEEYTIFRCDRYADNTDMYAPHPSNMGVWEGYSRGSFPYPSENANRSGAFDTIAVKV